MTRRYAERGLVGCQNDATEEDFAYLIKHASVNGRQICSHRISVHRLILATGPIVNYGSVLGRWH